MTKFEQKTGQENEKQSDLPLYNTTSTSTTLRPPDPQSKSEKTTAGPSDPQLNFKPHTQPSGALLEALDTDPNFGLSEDEVEKRRLVYGENRLKEVKGVSGFRIVLRQVGNAMTLILIAAMAVSLGTMDWISGGVIAALVILNVVVGSITEWQAEKTVANLESVGAPSATVIRHSTSTSPKVPTTKTIPVEQLVPGDIIVLVNGDIVPADGRVLEGFLSGLESDESMLTGESLPVAKQFEKIDEEDCPIGDRINQVYSGSMITKGRARVVVFATGMTTEMGKIAEALGKKADRKERGFAAYWYKFKVLLGVADTTPLQIKLNQLAYTLLGAAVIIAIIVVASTGFQTVPLSIATYAVAAAVSILPASLIAVVSLTLARASTDLASRNALVRRMDAIEALAGVENVCSDKTGTLTVGRMVVRKFWTPTLDDRDVPTSEIEGQGYALETGSDPFYPRGEVSLVEIKPESESLDLKEPKRSKTQDELDAADNVIHTDDLSDDLRELALCAGLCNQATLSRPDEKGDSQNWEAHGDPTEIALQVAAHKLAYGKPFLTHAKTHHSHHHEERRGSFVHRNGLGLGGHYEQVVEHPFDSTVKRMSIAYQFIPQEGSNTHIICLLKGAVERVLDGCSTINGEPITDAHTKSIIRKMDILAAQGLRVLALSSKRPDISPANLKAMDRTEFEKGFNFLGLAGIFDPPRKESAGAVADCFRAGITPRMLTGDHPATATAIALSIGILDRTYAKSSVMTGQEFDKLSDEQIDALEDLPLVVARCAPETKVRMVDAIHRRGQKTIMTGDGVNDSPALKRADVGVAMGSGSDVAKQAARIVLADDNFATIIRALRKGRSVFKNLSKFLLYLLSGNLAEIIVLMIGLAFKDENGQSVFPLSPVAALWINTLSAGPPALALGLEPTALDAMDLPPTAFHHIFTLEFYVDLMFYGTLMGALSLVNFVIVLWGYFPGDLGRNCNEGDSAICSPVFQARGTCFATLVIILMIHALECKHFTKGITQINLRDNKILLWCAVVLVLATFPVIYIPTINNDVFLVGSLEWEWGIVFGMIFIYLGATELYKYCKRVYARRHERQASKRSGGYDKTLRMENTIAP